MGNSMVDMGLFGEYDDNNIFAQIIDGKIPCFKVYEDDIAIAIMDAFPQAPGHVLVIPKAKARNFLDYPTEQLGALMERVQKITNAVQKALTPEGISMFQFSGAAGGQSVFHLHFHIVPRSEGVPLKGHGQFEPADKDELKVLAEKIKAAL